MDKAKTEKKIKIGGAEIGRESDGWLHITGGGTFFFGSMAIALAIGITIGIFIGINLK